MKSRWVPITCLLVSVLADGNARGCRCARLPTVDQLQLVVQQYSLTISAVLVHMRWWHMDSAEQERKAFTHQQFESDLDYIDLFSNNARKEI